jgi:hypothetical protein
VVYIRKLAQTPLLKQNTKQFFANFVINFDMKFELYFTKLHLSHRQLWHTRGTVELWYRIFALNFTLEDYIFLKLPLCNNFAFQNVFFLSLAPQPTLGLCFLHKIRLNFLEASQHFPFLQVRGVSPTPNPHPGGSGLCIYIPQRQGSYPF